MIMLLGTQWVVHNIGWFLLPINMRQIDYSCVHRLSHPIIYNSILLLIQCARVNLKVGWCDHILSQHMVWSIKMSPIISCLQCIAMPKLVPIIMSTNYEPQIEITIILYLLIYHQIRLLLVIIINPVIYHIVSKS